MKFILTALLCAFLVASFTGHKCEHVFVEVEQAIIKIERPGLTFGGIVYQEYCWPNGLQEGKDLICVKCFHVQKQILDYSKPETGPTLGALIRPQGSIINAGPFCDSLLIGPKCGWSKVDTSLIVHQK